MEKTGNTAVQVNTRMDPDLNAALDNFCAEAGIQKCDAVESAIRTMLLSKAAIVHPQNADDINSVKTSLDNILNHYLSAVNSSVQAKTEAEQIIRMATEETAAQNAKLKAELAEMKSRADQDANAASEATAKMKNAADAMANMEDRISILQEQKQDLEKKLELFDALKRKNVEFKKQLDRERDEKTEAFKRLADLTDKYLSTASNVRIQAEKLQARCLLLEQTLKDAGIDIPA